MFKSTLTAVRNSNYGLGASSPMGDPYQRPRGLRCASKSDLFFRLTCHTSAEGFTRLKATEFTGSYVHQCTKNTKGRSRRPFARFGRHNWIRTNDPHHVKVVL